MRIVQPVPMLVYHPYQ